MAGKSWVIYSLSQENVEVGDPWTAGQIEAFVTETDGGAPVRNNFV